MVWGQASLIGVIAPGGFRRRGFFGTDYADYTDFSVWGIKGVRLSLLWLLKLKGER